MAAAGCCFSSSHGHGLLGHGFGLLRLRLPATSASIRLRSAASPRRRRRPLLSSASASAPDPAPLGLENHSDERYGLEIEVWKKTGKRNRRVVRARVRVDAPLEAVWATLTDYERLADFIPGLAECRLLQRSPRFARLYQVGEQDLALGFKFNAKGTVDCFEGDMEMLPAAGARRRDIAFKMIDGDFKVFEGKWSVQEVVDTSSSIDAEAGQIPENQEFQTTLSYLVELEPKLWVPVRLLEGRICSEIKNNLVSIREQAQRMHRLQNQQV